MILIVGGTGALGSATARRLLAEGKPVRIMTRTPEKAEALKQLGAQVIYGDLLDRDSLSQACSGAEKVLAAAHSVLGRGREASKFVDLRGQIDLIEAAKLAGVEHFIYTSAYRYDPIYDSVPFYRYKYEVERYLVASGLNYTILRPTAFMESHAEKMIGRPILENGKVSLFGRGENPRNFIAADDAAQFAVMALQGRTLNRRTINLGGPENLTNMQVVRIYEKLAGKPAKVNHVPLGVLKIRYRLLRLVHPGLSQVMQASIYIDTVDHSFDPAPMLAAYPLRLARLEEWAARRVKEGMPTAVTTQV